MGDFSFRRDLKYVDWKRTFQLNLIRAAAAGLVVGMFIGLMFMLVGTSWGERATGLAMPFVYAVILPIGLPFYFAIAVVCGKLSEFGVPFIGWIPALFSIVFAFGDPIVFFLHRARPDLVPADQPSFMTLRLVIFVIDATRVPAVQALA